MLNGKQSTHSLSFNITLHNTNRASVIIASKIIYYNVSLYILGGRIILSCELCCTITDR